MADEPCGIFEFNVQEFNKGSLASTSSGVKRKRGRRGGKKHPKGSVRVVNSSESKPQNDSKAPWHALSAEDVQREEREEARRKLRERIKSKTRSRQKSAIALDDSDETDGSLAMAKRYMSSAGSAGSLTHSTLQQLARQHGLDPSMLQGLNRRKIKRRLDKVHEQDVSKATLSH